MGFTPKQARQYAGFTQQKMASILGISRDAYRKIEQYPEKTSIDLAKRLSKKKNISINQIFFSTSST